MGLVAEGQVPRVTAPRGAEAVETAQRQCRVSATAAAVSDTERLSNGASRWRRKGFKARWCNAAHCNFNRRCAHPLALRASLVFAALENGASRRRALVEGNVEPAERGATTARRHAQGSSRQVS